MDIDLIRAELRRLHSAADDAHAGLLLERGLPAHKTKGQQGGEGEDAKANAKVKMAHVERVCGVPAGEFYSNAFARWRKLTEDAQRFRRVTLALESRLFIGLAGGGALETGCAVGHSHGMPYIPGSSIKGVVRAHAREQLGEQGRAAWQELFGSEPIAEHRAGLAGLVGFHDAWWVPGSAASPFVQEVVTTHHMQYYSEGGRQAATDFDSPVPNAQVAVQGSFLFVIEGPCAWHGLAEAMLKDTLHRRGIGAKTRAGYGYFKPEAVQVPRPRCSWVDENMERLSKENYNAPLLEVLRGRPLAEAWAAITDPALKQEAHSDILARLEENQLAPSKRAQQIYGQPASGEAQ